MMISVFALILATASAAPERPAKPDTSVRVHRNVKTPAEKPPKTEPEATTVNVHKDKVPSSLEQQDAPAEAITEYHDDPVISADIAFQRCIEAEAEKAARADMPFEDFKKALPNLCAIEETRLAQRYADSRADGDPMKQVAGIPRSKSRALVFDYTEGLRQIVQAGYINLVKGRAPMRLDKALADWKKK